MGEAIYPAPGMSGPLWHRSIFRRMLTRYRTSRSRKRLLGVEIDHSLRLVSPQQLVTLGDKDLPLVFLCRNDRRLLPSFLKHYRLLGVTRFICVDDQSTDGSAEFLRSQSDVDLWTSSKRYKDARRGKAWRESLFCAYGVNRWYLNIDSDEFLIYEQCFERTLPELIRQLEALSIDRLAAPMLDMYPLNDMAAAEFTGDDERMPWQVADCYDGDGYEVVKNDRFVRIRGGVRRRVFGADVDLMKYPLIYWDKDCSLGENIHQPLPYDRNFSPIFGVLLHFKFFSDYQERVQQAIEGGQHFGGAREYVNMMEKISANPEISLGYTCSVHFTTPAELLERGFLTQVFGG